MADDDRLTGVNDSWLEPLIRATDDDVEAMLERLIVTFAEPVIATVLQRHSRAPNRLSQQDLEDIAATVRLRLVQKLRAVRESEDEAIGSFENYVAVTTLHAFIDYVRSLHPARSRLKGRVRYVLRSETRIRTWTSQGRDFCALGTLGEPEPRSLDEISGMQFPSAVFVASRPSAAIVALLGTIEGAIAVDDLVTLLGALWQLGDSTAPVELAELSQTYVPSPTAELENRQYLELLWREIVVLRPAQRKALLLNLRAGEELNLLSLLILAQVTTFDALAAVLDMTPGALAELWNQLPLEDNRIAGMLGGTRQQVINLRKSARQRLGRRMRGK